jgi:hypothetical protein
MDLHDFVVGDPLLGAVAMLEEQGLFRRHATFGLELGAGVLAVVQLEFVAVDCDLDLVVGLGRHVLYLASSPMGGRVLSALAYTVGPPR